MYSHTKSYTRSLELKKYLVIIKSEKKGIKVEKNLEEIKSKVKKLIQ